MTNNNDLNFAAISEYFESFNYPSGNPIYYDDIRTLRPSSWVSSAIISFQLQFIWDNIATYEQKVKSHIFDVLAFDSIKRFDELFQRSINRDMFMKNHLIS